MASKSLIKGTIVLMVSSLVVRVLGFFYRIYLSNLIGAEGMGLIQLVTPVYALVITTLTSGISIAVSSIVSSEHAKHNVFNTRRITACAFVMVFTCAAFVSVLMYINLEFIVKAVFKDSRTYHAMLFLLPCFPVISAASALRGYFYGTQDMVPTAVSQVAEQVVRITLVMLTAGFMLKLGLEYACAVATAGMAIGEISNLTILAVVYSVKKRRQRISAGYRISRRRAVTELLKIAIPVSSNRFISSVMNTVENILIPRMLTAGGLNYQLSISMFGKLSGMAMPLVYFPSVVTSSMATTLVPAVAEAVSLRNFRTANYRISRSIQISFIMGFIFTSIFYTNASGISDVIYKYQDVGGLLKTLSFSCVFIYLQQTLHGILNGLGKQGSIFRHVITANIIRIFFVVFLMPVYGVNAYLAGMFISMAVSSGLDINTVMKTTGMILDIKNWIIKPGIAGVCIILMNPLFHHFVSIFTSSQTLSVLLTVILNFLAGIVLMAAIGAISFREIRDMLKIKKI